MDVALEGPLETAWVDGVPAPEEAQLAPRHNIPRRELVGARCQSQSFLRPSLLRSDAGQHQYGERVLGVALDRPPELALCAREIALAPPDDSGRAAGKG